MLAQAVSCGQRVRLSLRTNIEPHENINQAERAFIKKHNSAGDKSWQLND